MEVKIDSNNEVFETDPWFDRETFREEFCRSIGLPETIPVKTALEQLLGEFISITPENEERINLFLALVVAQKPISLIEASLIVQTLAAHRLSTTMLAKADKASHQEVAEKYINMSMKLSRGFRSGLEMLAKFQRDKM